MLNILFDNISETSLPKSINDFYDFTTTRSTKYEYMIVVECITNLHKLIILPAIPLMHSYI